LGQVLPETDLAELIPLAPDPRLAGEDRAQLPDNPPPPVVAPSPRGRGTVVAAGVALTGVTLVLGLALAAVSAVMLLGSGGGSGALVLLVTGVVLVSTHWGWVHVAELTSQRLERRDRRELELRHRDWVSEIRPYPRCSVTSEALEGGGVNLISWRHTPVATGRGTFTFRREMTAEERHRDDEPAAAVAERAELLRREAAQATRRARERYDALAADAELQALSDADERERQEAAQAAAQALAEGINANLQRPPLEE
jgi:hypothetical protein